MKYSASKLTLKLTLSLTLNQTLTVKTNPIRNHNPNLILQSNQLPSHLA